MPFSVVGVMKLLTAVGPVVAKLPEFRDHFRQVVDTFKQKDQQTLISAYRELQAENAGGHARLQEMLRQAEQEG